MRVDLIQESTTILLVKDTCESPWLLLHGLHVLDLNHKDIAWLGCLNLKRPGQVVDPSQIDGSHVVYAVVVADLTTSPVQALDLDDFAILDLAGKGDYLLLDRSWMRAIGGRTVRVPSILQRVSRRSSSLAGYALT